MFVLRMAGKMFQFFDREFKSKFNAVPNLIYGIIFACLSFYILYKWVVRALRRAELNAVRKSLGYADETGSNSGDSVCTECVRENIKQHRIHNERNEVVWGHRAHLQLDYAIRRRNAVPQPKLITPKEYVQLDRQWQIEKRKLEGCMISLTSQFNNVTSIASTEERRKKLLEEAKENAACSSTSNSEMLHDISNLAPPTSTTYEYIASPADIDCKPRCKSI